jgi:hypothetical protein
MHIVSGSISTKTGVPPLITIACAVDTKLSDGKITSLFFMSISDKDRFSAAVPLLTAIQSSEPRYFLNWFSNFNTFPVPEPDAQNLLSKTCKIFCLSSFHILGSNSLIFFVIVDYPL